MPRLPVLATILFSALIGGGIGYFGLPHSSTPMVPHKETAYERVMRTGTLRCGYFSWPPYMARNLKTREFEGFFYDYVEAAAKRMGIKVEWAAEVVYGNIYEEIRSGRIDAFCSGIWPTSGFAKLLDFTIPISFNGVFAVARGDDRRFDGNLFAINDPAVRISSMEGGIGSVIAGTRFPKATLYETPIVSGASAPFMEIMANKADVTFVDRLLMKEFLKSNPDKLKVVADVPPVNVWGNTIAFGKHEEALVNAMNTTTQEMLYSGEISLLLRKYDSSAEGLYEGIRPYREQ